MAKNILRSFLSISCILLILRYLLFFLSDEKVPAFRILTSDSIPIDVFACTDSINNLIGYEARVNSPICESTECYDVELDFFWNTFGSFQRYEIVPEKPLTKREHEPFTTRDYQKLTEVLHLQHPAFLGMRKEEMIENLKSDGLDGFTGATIAVIKNDIVPGAAYSCYTLWHIAHGSIVDSIKKHTEKYLNAALIDRLLASDDEKAHFYLMEHLSIENIKANMDRILDLMTVRGGYFARYAIKAFPNKLFDDPNIKLQFAQYYFKLDYFAKVNLVKQLKGHKIDSTFALVLLEDITPRSSALAQGIVELLAVEGAEFSKEVKERILARLITSNLKLSQKLYLEISQWSSESRRLKKQVKKLLRT